MEQYYNIQAQFQADLNVLKKRKSGLSNLRLLFFVLFAIAFYFYVSEDNLSILLISLALFFAFMVFVVKSTNIGKKINYLEDALAALDVIFKDDQPNVYHHFDGEFFNNVYNKDLDIIEGQSLFNRINKTQSAIGSYRLKHFLSHVLLDKNQIHLRQKAFAELKEKRSFIVEFLTLSKRAGIQQSEIFGAIQRQFYGKTVQFIPIIFTIIHAIIFIYLATIGFDKKAVFFWIVISIPIGFITNLMFKNKVNQALSYAFVTADQLQNLIDLFALVEKETFEQDLNQEVQKQLISDQGKASDQLKNVRSSLESLEAVGFPIIGFLLNNFLLWKLFFTVQIENRIEKVAINNAQWIDGISNLEAYISFAVFNTKYSSFITPTISDQIFDLQLRQAFHPLLNEEIAVKNSFESHRKNNIAIITGANMAGKSTFLRTVGTNLVLAMNGANVSAEEMVFYPMDLFTSIRTVDNLSSGDSYFKNEINKLKILIDRLDQNLPQYIILDEILKGTNSQDKLIGSQKFLEKLMHHPTNLVCFIATHDLELTKMEEEYPNHIVNYCFELKNVDEHYYSDYQLRKGTTQVMNAIYLMKEFKIIDA